MSKIISVQPVPEHFSITWMLGSLCNYDCMYCSSELHDRTSKPHDLDRLKQAWYNIYEKSNQHKLNYKISFTGGEVTANKSFLPFVFWLRAECKSIDMILITTNGSASLNYYKKLSDVVESMSFSTHSEYMDEADFFSKVKSINQLMIRPKKSLHVNIMDEPWNRHRIPLYEQFCKDNDISYSINRVHMIHRIRDTHAPLPEPTLEKLARSS